MKTCNHCYREFDKTSKGYCEECYPLYCCEDCGKFVDEQHRLCDDCWEESDEYIED